MWMRLPLVFAALAMAAGSSLAGEVASVDSLLARGDRALEGGDADRAEELYTRALELSDGDPRARYGLANVGLARDDCEFVIEHARKAVKKDRKNSEYHLALAYGYGMKASEGGMKAVFYGGKFKRECELAIKYDPENVAAHMAVLRYYAFAPGFAGGGMDKAEETVETIASLDPYSGYLAEAFLAWQRGDTEAAERAYVAAARVDTTDPRGWESLGALYMRERRYADAVPVGERVLALEPDNMSAVYQLAKAHLLSGDDLEAAERGFRAYIDSPDRPSEPSEAAARWRLGMVYERAGRLDDAKAEWESALALDPEFEKAAADLDTLRTAHPALWQ